MSLSHASIAGLPTTFNPPVVHEPVTAADVGNSAEFLHMIKRAKADGHIVVTPDTLGRAELTHKKILDRVSGAAEGAAVVFTQADRDTLQEIKLGNEEIKAHLKNLPRRIKNSRARDHPHTLVRLGVEESTSQHALGTLPSFKRQEGDNSPPPADGSPCIFPATRGDLVDLTTSDLDELQQFYAVRFVGASKAARLHSFMEYIGT